MKLKLVAFGIRALPPIDGCGGAETFAEELYTRILEKGHEVTVYCRKYIGENNNLPKSYKNLKLIYLPTVKLVGFDTLFHSFLCTLHIIIFNTGKIIHIHNAGNSIFVPILKLFGKKCYISMDGIDWKRTRWSWYAKIYLQFTNLLALKVANKVIVDNLVVQKHYIDKYNLMLDYIPYGSNILMVKGTETLRKFNLRKNEYILFVGRFSLEKGVHYLIKAFESINSTFNLVLVGDDLFNKEWVSQLKSTSDSRIIFTGFLYGTAVDELIQNCYIYVQPSDVEGLSPVILRVMGMGKCVLSSDIPENRFLVENRGHLFRKGDVESLNTKIQFLLSNKSIVEEAGIKSLEHIEYNYSWDYVTQQHLNIFLNN